MRDAHRMKEKLDLSLDHRQVVSLLMGGVVVLGAVFVLGVVVGKRLAAPTGPADSAYVLSALDQKTQALEKVRASPLLTFQEELTRKGVDPVVPDAGHLAAPAAVAEGVRPAAEKASEKPAEPIAAKVPVEKTTAGLDRPAVEKPAVEKPATERPTPDKPSATKPALKEALAKVDRPAPQTTATSVAPPGSGRFTLQLAASPVRAEADHKVAKLKERGYSPYVVSAEVAGKGTFYRVRMGNFATKEAAQKFLADFKRETQMEAFVASTP